MLVVVDDDVATVVVEGVVACCVSLLLLEVAFIEACVIVSSVPSLSEGVDTFGDVWLLVVTSLGLVIGGLSSLGVSDAGLLAVVVGAFVVLVVASSLSKPSVFGRISISIQSGDVEA